MDSEIKKFPATANVDYVIKELLKGESEPLPPGITFYLKIISYGMGGDFKKNRPEFTYLKCKTREGNPPYSVNGLELKTLPIMKIWQRIPDIVGTPEGGLEVIVCLTDEAEVIQIEEQKEAIERGKANQTTQVMRLAGRIKRDRSISTRFDLEKP